MAGTTGAVGMGRGSGSGIIRGVGATPTAAPGTVDPGGETALAVGTTVANPGLPGGGASAATGGVTNVISAQSVTQKCRRIRRTGGNAQVFK